MSIVTNKDEDKSRLSQRINADLRAKWPKPLKFLTTQTLSKILNMSKI